MENPSKFLLLTAIGATFFLLPTESMATVNAANDIFGGGENPLDQFLSFLTGGFATTIAVIAVVVLGAMIIMGSDFGGFGRRVPMVIVGIGFVIFATQVVSFLTGTDASGMLYDPASVFVEHFETTDPLQHSFDR